VSLFLEIKVFSIKIKKSRELGFPQNRMESQILAFFIAAVCGDSWRKHLFIYKCRAVGRKFI
jgi:hypothetical protein